MKSPATFRQKRAEVGAKVLAGTLTEKSATALLTKAAMDDPALVAQIVADHASHFLAEWLTKHRVPSDEDERPGLFPDLPRQIEISPGRFKFQEDMTGPDWDAALVQAETKERNAGGRVEKVRAARKTVRHLLTDDEMTTAQVMEHVA